VLDIPLATALDDPDVEVLARIRDVAGNETEVRRTVRWLLDSPLPPDPAGTSSGADESGPASASDGDTAAGSASDTTAGAADADDEGGAGCGCAQRSGGARSLPAVVLAVASVTRLRRRRPRA
jgi:hypothetical protein